jgi:uncharacterized protein YdhG (YjbR/CyaY superfamily)
MARAKPASDPQAVEVYLANIPEPARSTLLKVRAILRAAAPPDTTESISYGLPMLKYKGVLLGYGGFSDHCSLFLGTGDMVAQLGPELARYSVSKGTVRFPVDKPLPAALLRKILRLRVAQNEARKSAHS